MVVLYMAPEEKKTQVAGTTTCVAAF